MHANQSNHSDIVANLRDHRKAAGLSQQRLAELARCSISMVRLLEADYQPASLSAVLTRIGEVLGEEAVAPMS